jgi:SAM-dependent methyltransferase
MTDKPQSVPDDMDAPDPMLPLDPRAYWDRRAEEGYLVRSPKAFAEMRDQYFFEFLVARIPDSGNDLIIGLGCGPGDFLSTVAASRPNHCYRGFDLSPKQIRLARSRHPFLAFDELEAVDRVPDGSIGIVVIQNVLAHCKSEEARGLLAAATRIARADGVILIFEQTNSVREVGPGFVRRTRAEYIGLLHGAGLSLEESVLVTFPLYQKVIEGWVLPT